MDGVVAVTDHEWFQFLRQQGPLEEVNFWRPSDTRTPRQLLPGMPVFFKLKRAYGGWIVGWGTFARHDVLPAWLAWDAFGPGNGAATFAEMRKRIERLRRDGTQKGASGDYPIGCLMLSAPTFLERSSWVRPPAEWPENTVQGKSYPLTSGEGARIWRECQAAAARPAAVGEPSHEPMIASERFGEPILFRPRLGQGTFRLAVTSAYGRACAVTLEHSLPALEAAHIRPYGEGGAHEVPNGLLLRSDIHRLFDKGYVGVTPDHRFVVSRKLKDDYANGRTYYPLHGREIKLPERVEERPSPQWLAWHMEERFRG